MDSLLTSTLKLNIKQCYGFLNDFLKYLRFFEKNINNTMFTFSKQLLKNNNAMRNDT